LAEDLETRKVLILVEGQTEEAFVKRVLSGHLAAFNLSVVPVIARTKRTPSGATFKGGTGSYYKVEKQLLGLLADTSASLVTTMFDYYAFPGILGTTRPTGGSPSLRARLLEDAIKDAVVAKQQGDTRRFHAYLSLHEFESLLFSSTSSIADALGAHQLPELERIRAHLSPEEIDDDPATCPSARLRRLYPKYKKRIDGPIIVGRIGLDAIRRECPHFNEWLTFLEGRAF
jgi:hypothetical protein